MPPRQTNRISSKRPYLYVVGIIQAGSRFRLTCKRDTQRFSASRKFVSKIPERIIVIQISYETRWIQKFRIESYAGKLPRWKLLSISIQALISNRIQNYPIRLALTKSYEKSQILEFVSRYILEIEIRNRAFQTVRGLRTNELQSPDTYFDT